MILPDYRSTVSTNLTVDKTTYGSYVRLYNDDKYLNLRLLVSVKINLHAERPPNIRVTRFTKLPSMLSKYCDRKNPVRID